MKIAIVEDNIIERNRLVSCINQYSSENQLPLTIDTYSDGLEIVDKYSGNLDIIYFDVEMPLMDGMTAAKRIRKIDENVVIVFITNYVQFAIEGYAVNASDFLLKPLTYFNFSEHFKKIVPKIKNKKNNTLTLKTNAGIRKIDLTDLYYIESEGHYLHFHTSKQTFTILESMKKMEEKLKHEFFFRCNNCYLVNLKHVKAIEKNTAILGEFHLQISRPRKKEFLSALTDYIGSGLL